METGTPGCKELIKMSYMLAVEADRIPEIVVEKHDVTIYIPIGIGLENIKLVMDSLGLLAGDEV
jgi:hypothetical protein